MIRVARQPDERMRGESDGRPSYAMAETDSDDVAAVSEALFVRHPFERLVSTYIDKALRSREEIAWAYSSYWDKIPGVKAENRSPTFAEFVDLVLAMPVENSDTHWSPYYHRCQPCLVDYDFIGKLETANRDFPLFFSLVGIEDQAASLHHDNRRESVSGAHRIDSKYYFAQLSFEQVMRLYARYFYDFALFGYEFTDYLT
ncbi:hypothetical protein HPB49_025256 [Dermacentor silvarum]|uniref:Uncharacterized protein n=1 Tax=Dermacentor silvarum TaxID=543639 RepID=A0ACB8DI05_DERSI|nr:hypothetical protein HPB49_025256 [Dermacentor silvarum]